MLLTELTEELANWLGSSPEKWTQEQVTVTAELDPAACIGNTLGVYLIPNFTGYNIGQSNARPRSELLSVTSTLFVSLVVSKVFKDLPTSNGVANWNEAKVIIDTRERAERYLLQYTHPDVLINSVEANDIEEQQLDLRNFVSMTTFGYNQISCASELDLNSALDGYSNVYGSGRIGDSGRR